VGLAIVLGWGCASREPSREQAGETQTSGVITVASEPAVLGLVRATAQAFQGAYPAASIRVVARDSHDAMNDVFGNRADLAIVGREIEPIERQTATEAGIDMEAYRWAWDGVAVIVHPRNPVNQVSLDDLRRILTGTSSGWGELGGSDRPVVPVLESPRRSLTQFTARAIVEAGDSLTAALLVDDDSSVVAAVARMPDALGFVSQSSLRPGVKVLSVSRATGMPYVAPDAETVYHRDYPLTRSYNLVTRTPGRPLSQGFLTYALSEAGQRVVRDAHLVPASVPVRFTHRLPTVSSHGQPAPAAAQEGDPNR
jgi:phosphate transport system substrate-binding protein